MSDFKKIRLARLALAVTVPLAAALGGCAETTVISSSNPSRDRPSGWRDFNTLPVVILGDVADHPHAELASLYPAPAGSLPDGGRHVVMYVNADRMPAKPALCADGAHFTPGVQAGNTARVTAALCDGNNEITRASGKVVTAGQSPRWLRKGFDVVRNQLFQSLYPGTNNPDATFQN